MVVIHFNGISYYKPSVSGYPHDHGNPQLFPGKGPAFFPGGTLSVWNDVRHIVEAAAAKAADGRPCATMNGKGGAGSCVKMSLVAGRMDKIMEKS